MSDGGYDTFRRTLRDMDRRNRQERLRADLAAVRRAQKAGLVVKSAIIGGVRMEFGDKPEAVPEPGGPIDTPDELRRLI
jgi:hypothetical protein